MVKRILRNVRNSVGISLSWVCVSYHSLWFLCADGYSLGRASGDNSAELTWKYYAAHVCLKYNLHLVGYPREEICDPSNLSVKELYTLQESLQNGTCSFKPLPVADRDALQVMVDEQERSGKNPMGKRKRRIDAGKPRKKGQTAASTMQLGSTDLPPPSCSPSDHQNHEIQCDADIEGMDISGMHPEYEPQTMGAYQDHSEGSNEFWAGLPAHGSVDLHDGSMSGEDEVVWDSGDDPIPQLARCIESLGDGEVFQEWDPEDG